MVLMLNSFLATRTTTRESFFFHYSPHSCFFFSGPGIGSLETCKASTTRAPATVVLCYPAGKKENSFNLPAGKNERENSRHKTVSCAVSMAGWPSPNAAFFMLMTSSWPDENDIATKVSSCAWKSYVFCLHYT